MRWMIENQLSRRNLNPIERVEVAEKYRPFFKKKAEEKMNEGINQFSPLQKSAKPTIHTRDELAKIAKVSHDTYGKAKNVEYTYQVNNP